MKLHYLTISLILALGATSAIAGKSKPIEPIMVTIPAGSFEMGSTANENSQPLHKVKMSEFSMGKYEVTVAEFARFVAATNYPVPESCYHELDGWFSNGATKGNWQTNSLNTSEYQPVVCINWKAADAYTKWLAKETGKPYRLPTEAEWEYAARAGTKTDYFFGNDKDRTQVCEYANTADLYGENVLQRDTNTSYYNWTTGMTNCVDHSAYASIVGMYKPNQFGLHDMVSNVLEFLADCYVGTYENAPTDGSAVLSGECEYRSTRGGSWHWNNWPLAERGRIDEDFSGGVDGFRVALDGAAPKKSKQTKIFAHNLKHQQNLEQKRRDNHRPFPDQVTGLKLKQSKDKVTLNWNKVEGEKVKYRVYRNFSEGGIYKLLASNLTDPQFIDANINKFKYEYTVVAVQNHVQGMYAEPVQTKAHWFDAPGTIQAQWNASVTGTTLANTSDVSGRFNLTGPGGIANEATITFKVIADKAGTYDLEYRVAAPRDTKGFEIFNNDKSDGINIVAKTGGYHEWSTQTGGKVHLRKGKNVIVLKSLDNNWKLNWLSFK